MQSLATQVVLIVDDEANIRLALAMSLEAAGASVDEAASGEAAVQKLAEKRYDLVCLDLRLGATDGLALLPAICAHNAAAGIIAISAYAITPAETALMYQRGVHGILAKPFTPRQAAAAAAEALQRARCGKPKESA